MNALEMNILMLQTEQNMVSHKLEVMLSILAEREGKTRSEYTDMIDSTWPRMLDACGGDQEKLQYMCGIGYAAILELAMDSIRADVDRSDAAPNN